MKQEKALSYGLRLDRTQKFAPAQSFRSYLRRGSLIRPVACTALVMFVGMTVYECTKQFIFPSITIWQSHFLTIVITTGMAAGFSYLALKRQAQLQARSVQEAASRAAAEAQLVGSEERLRGLPRAEEALRMSEERYRTLFDSNPHPMWVYDVDTLEFLAANEAAVANYGYSRAEFLCMTIKDIRRAEDLPALMASLVPGGTFTNSGAWKHRRKDGTIIEAEIASHALDFGPRSARLVVAYDVTERRKVEESRERLVAILEATPDLVAISPVSGPAFYINAAGRRLLGVGPEDVINLLDHRSVAAAKLITEEAVPIAISAGAWCGETLLLCRDGEEVPVSQVLIAHKGPTGDVEFLSTIARDIRGQRRLEAQFRQAQKMEAIGRLASGVAHDFNNLLTIISGYGQMLLGGLPKGDPKYEMLQQIVTAGESATALTRQLLAFSRKQIVSAKTVSVTELLTGMEKMLRRLLGEDIELAASKDPDLGFVNCDPGQLEQVVMNLAVNARDAMPLGGRLTIEARNVDLDEAFVRDNPAARVGPHVLLALTDTGVGMDAVTQAQIFEPFFTTKGDKGTGLGLATVYAIVQLCGGHIHIRSQPGQGTTISVFLPRVEQQGPTSKSNPGNAAAPKGCETILMVEDEDGVRALASFVLRTAGYMVLEASGGEHALDVAARHRADIDILVSDVVMPRLGGLELADRLTALRPTMKVLFLSGYTDHALLRHGILKGEVRFLQKPFSPGALARKVREVLDHVT